MTEQPLDLHPADVDATSAAHRRRLLRSRTVGYGFGVGCPLALVLGAMTGHPLAALLAPLAVAALVLAVAFVNASKHAEADFYTALARDFGYSSVDHLQLPALTPLLGAGRRRWCEHYMAGPLGGELDGVSCGLGQYVWEVQQQGSDGDERKRRYRLTICVIDLEPALAMFKGIFVRRRRGVFGDLIGDDWLQRSDLHDIKLESEDFNERYELQVTSDQDEVALRQLLSPSFIVWLSTHPLAPSFECFGGSLVVFLEREVEDRARIEMLRDAGREIAARLTTQARERVLAGV